MKSSRWFPAFFSLILLTGYAAAQGQQNPPHLSYVLPAGGQQGTTFQIKAGGQFLPNVNQVYFSGKGIQASVGEYSRPMTAMQATQLREKLQEMQKLPADSVIRTEIADIREKLFIFAANRNISPALAETVTLQVIIAPNAEIGKQEIRLQTPQGISNPLVFCVGQLPEFSEKEPIGFAGQPGINPTPVNPPATEIRITLPAVVNGRIKPSFPRTATPGRQGQQFTPGDADRYRFSARQGQQLVIIAGARELIPYLADAVPGWFQATVTLYDGNGKELAYNDDYRFHPDPVLHFTIPRNGEYVAEIKDALFRGREDFVYRLTIGELPFVTGIFPLGGRAGAATETRLSGWNLSTNKLTVEVTEQEAGSHPLTVNKGELVSNRVSFAVDTLAEALEKENNNTPKKAQKVKLPTILNGRIDKPGDWDLFRFQGQAGEEIVAEVSARRLDSPLDSLLKLTDDQGKQLAFNDDHEDKGSGLDTHHADSLITAVLPQKGTYYLHLGDAQQKGGLDYTYRLRISAPRPDFQLRLVPSGINAVGGITFPLTVYALRKDGFSGDIVLGLPGAPRGFTLSGAVLPAGRDQVRFTLTIPPVPPQEPFSLNLEGCAVIQGQKTCRTVVPAEDMMQAFAYRHLVPAQDLRVSVRRGAGVVRSAAKILSSLPVKIPLGQTVRIQVQGPLLPNGWIDKVQYELSEPPAGIALQDAFAGPNGTEILLQCDASKAKPGLKGNLIIPIFAERRAPSANNRPPNNRQRIPLGTLPAVPFEIIPPF